MRIEHTDRRASALPVAIAFFTFVTACGVVVAGETEEVPAATELTVQLETTLNSERHGSGDVFTSSVRNDVTDAEGRTLIPAGARVHGHIADFSEDPPRLKLEFDRIEVRGDVHDLQAELLALTPRRHSEMTDEGAKIGGGAAAGALLGAVIGGGAKEAVIGAAAGAAAGTGVALATKESHAYLPAGSTMRIRLIEPLHVRLPESDESPPEQSDRQ